MGGPWRVVPRCRGATYFFEFIWTNFGRCSRFCWLSYQIVLSLLILSLPFFLFILKQTMNDPIRHVASCQLWVRATEENLTRGRHVPDVPYVPRDPLGGVLVDHSFTHILPRDPNLNFTQFLLASDLYVLKRTEPFYQLQHWFARNWTTGKGRAYASLYANPVLVTTDDTGVPQNPMVPVTAHSKMTRPGMTVRTSKQKSELFKRMFKIIVEVPFAQYEHIDDASFHSNLLKVSSSCKQLLLSSIPGVCSFCLLTTASLQSILLFNRDASRMIASF